MELPDPGVSEELVEFLNDEGRSAKTWHDISAVLKRRESEQDDLQAGWLMTAFDYHLTRRAGEMKNRNDAFGEQMSGGGITYPIPLPNVPEEVVALWARSAERVTAPPIRARLHHLSFECQEGDKGGHLRSAAVAYLEVGTSDWDRLYRANCLHWALSLFKMVGDTSGVERAISALIALATESVAQEKPEPGVALHALEVVADQDSNHPDLSELLSRARETYAYEPFLIDHVINIEEVVYRADHARRDELRRERVEAYLNHAMSFPPGLLRMAFLEDAARLADRYGIADLLSGATEEMQNITMEDLDFQVFSATAEIPADLVNAHVSSMVDHETLKQVFESLASVDPPTGRFDVNVQASQQLAQDAPLTSLFPTKLVSKDALPTITASSEEDREDEKLARVELMGLGLGAEVTGRVLDGAFERFHPSEAQLVEAIMGLPHVSEPVARSISRALTAFANESWEAAAVLATPRIETLVRVMCDEKGVLQFRTQRDTKEGRSTRGQFPQLGALLGQLRPWISPSWFRYLWTFLVSPFGPNFRNELWHGYVDEVSRPAAALSILAALHLALTPPAEEPHQPPGVDGT